MNLPLIQLARMLSDARISYAEEKKSTLALRTAFMKNFPDYPVVKLRVRPGEPYIAPTENVIHDGSTAGQTSFDLQLSVRGRFRPSMEKAFHRHSSRSLAAEAVILGRYI